MQALSLQEQHEEAKKAHQEYYKRRVELFSQYKARAEEAKAKAAAENVPIKVILPDGAGEWRLRHGIRQIRVPAWPVPCALHRRCRRCHPVLAATTDLQQVTPCISLPSARASLGLQYGQHASMMRPRHSAHACAVCSCSAEKAGVKGVTTPMDIANAISKGLAKKVVVSKVDGAVWDLTRPLEGDCALQLLSFDDPEGKEVGAWLGRAVERAQPGRAAIACAVVGRQPGAIIDLVATDSCLSAKLLLCAQVKPRVPSLACVHPTSCALLCGADLLALVGTRAGAGTGAGVRRRPDHRPRPGGGLLLRLLPGGPHAERRGEGGDHQAHAAGGGTRPERGLRVETPLMSC